MSERLRGEGTIRFATIAIAIARDKSAEFRKIIRKSVFENETIVTK